MNKIGSSSNIFGKLTIILFLFGLLMHYFFEGRFEFTGTRNIFLILSLIAYFLKIVSSRKIQVSKDFLVYALCAIPIMLLSVGFWFSLSEINVYLTLIFTLIVITSDFEFLKKSIIAVIYILLILTIFEFISKSYVFIVYRDTEWGVLPLDPYFYGGYSKVFRAKGLFEGPLALSQFAIGSALIFRNNLKIIIVTIILSILANGRLGILITSLVLILYFVNRYNIILFLISKKGLKILLGLFLLLLFIGRYFITDKTLERISAMLSADDAGNTARFHYWEKAVDVFLNYDFVHMLFGNSGYFRHITGNSAENGWLMLFLNNGIIGFLYYFMPVLLLMLLSMYHKRIYAIHLLLLILCMFIQTFHLGALASLFYWLIIYVLFISRTQIFYF